MIDIHTHILPNIDDGARNKKESLELIRMSIDTGVKKIVFTPHYLGKYKTSYYELEEYFNSFKKEIESNFQIEVFLGQEIYYSSNIFDLLKDKKVNSINNSKYTLTELPMNKRIDCEEFFYELKLVNKKIVLAHPERYLWMKISEIEKLVDSGVYIQINSGSLLGEFGSKVKKRANNLMKQNLVHFIASDSHRTNIRIPNLDKVKTLVTKKYGESKAKELLIDNPNKLLLDKTI